MVHPAVVSLAIIGGGVVGAITGVFVNSIGKTLRSYLKMGSHSYGEFRDYAFRPFNDLQILPTYLMISLTTPVVISMLFMTITSYFGIGTMPGVAISVWIMIGLFFMGMYSMDDKAKKHVDFYTVMLGYVIVASFLLYNLEFFSESYLNSLKVMLLCILIREINDRHYSSVNQLNARPSILQHMYWEPIFVAEMMETFIRRQGIFRLE
jgi:hypothetical protein